VSENSPPHWGGGSKTKYTRGEVSQLCEVSETGRGKKEKITPQEGENARGKRKVEKPMMVQDKRRESKPNQRDRKRNMHRNKEEKLPKSWGQMTNKKLSYKVLDRHGITLR